MDLKSFAVILKEARTFVDQSQVTYKDEIVQILDGIGWVITFLSNYGLNDIILNSLNGITGKSNAENINENKNEEDIDFNKINTLESIKKQEKSPSSTKDYILKLIKNITPHLTKLFKIVHKIYYWKENGMKECSEMDHHTLDNCVLGLQSIGYFLNFALLVWGFYAIYNAKKSNLTKEKQTELENRIKNIEKLIVDANSVFENQDSKKFESLHEDIRDAIDDFNVEINKLEFEINGQICSMRVVKQNGINSTIGAVIGAAINIVDIIHNPLHIMPKVFLGLDVLIGIGGFVTIKLSMENLKDLKSSLKKLSDFRDTVKQLRDAHKKKYKKYLESK